MMKRTRRNPPPLPQRMARSRESFRRAAEALVPGKSPVVLDSHGRVRKRRRLKLAPLPAE